MVLASFDFGVTWDEADRHRNGQRVWEFVRGLRGRADFAETGGHVYPGLFDAICAALVGWLPEEWNRFVVRHAVTATVGWIGIVFAGRLAARLFGPWTGALAMVLLAASPRYFASAMNNPKDLPFAAASVAALYYISTVSPRWPYLPASTAIKIALALAVALNVRVGALVYLGYFGALVAAIVIIDRCSDRRRLADTAARVLAIVLAVLLLGTLFWPWAGGAPLTRPFQALAGAARFPWGGLVLFDGFAYEARDLPWVYVPTWFLISTPPVVLAGAALSVLLAQPRRTALTVAGLWTVVLSPVAAAVALGSTLYDGVRHLLFVYPVLAVLAAAGWTGLLHAGRPALLRTGAALALAAGLATILLFNVRFHPNQGVYFNEFVGGPRGAFARYEMDYWGNCFLQALEWSAGVARSRGTTITVAGAPHHLVQYNLPRFPELRFARESDDEHHVHVRLVRGRVAAVREMAARPAVHQVRTPDGAVLCTVTAGPKFAELESSRAQARPHQGSASR